VIRIRIRLPQTLNKLKKRALRNAIKNAVARSAERYVTMMHDYIDAGKAFTPRTGHLQRTIGWRMESENSAVVFANAEYAPFVELGTRPHTILPKRAQALRFEKGGRWVFAKRVNHPGSKPYPFFYAELEERERAVENEFVEALREWLEEVDG